MSSTMTRYVGPSTMLRPKTDVMRNFLDHWYEDISSGSIEIAWRDPETRKVNRAEHFDIRDPALVEFAARVNSVPGQDVYFTPAVVSTVKGRATDTQFIMSPGFWLDQDKPEQVAFADTISHPFFATSRVHTGTQPYLRRQMWFRLTEPVRDASIVRECNERLIALYTGDPAVKNPARLMRLPGSIAWPWKEGRVPENVEWVPFTDGRALKHTLQNALDNLPFPTPSSAAQLDRVSGMPTQSELVARIMAGDEWHNSVNRLIGHWVSRGLNDEEILVWAPKFTLGDYSIDQTEAEMQESIDGARAKWGYIDQDYSATTHYENVQSGFGVIEQEEVPAVEFRSRLQSVAELFVNHGARPEFLIDDVLARGATCLITGIPGAGKSPVAQEIAACVGLGIDWLGHKVNGQGKVVYIAGESHNQTAQNLPQFGRNLMHREEGYDPYLLKTKQQAAESMGDCILTLTAAFMLDDKQENAHLITEIEYEISDKGRWNGAEGPDLVIFDTLRAISSGSVNDDEAMIAVQQAVDLIKRRFPRACLIVLHHSPKGDPEGSSGSNRLEAMSEIIVNIAPMGLAKSPDAADAILKKKETHGPDRDGFVYTPFRIAVQRNKMWAPIPPKACMLKVRQDDLYVIYGAERNKQDAIFAAQQTQP